MNIFTVKHGLFKEYLELLARNNLECLTENNKTPNKKAKRRPCHISH